MGSRPGRRSVRWDRIRAEWKAAGLPCQICHQPIDYTAPAGDPDAFEVDHIKPLATHPELAEDIANTRPVHSGCNRRRRYDSPLAPRAGVDVSAHNYSPSSGGITSRDWNGDFHRNAWHRDNPGQPCSCAPVVAASTGPRPTRDTPPGTPVVAVEGSRADGYSSGATGTLLGPSHGDLIRVRLDTGRTVDARPWRWAIQQPAGSTDTP